MSEENQTNILDELINNNTSNTIIFIDGSYYCFYRYFSLLTWWKNAHPEEKLEDPYQNSVFLEKFKKIY